MTHHRPSLHLAAAYAILTALLTNAGCTPQPGGTCTTGNCIDGIGEYLYEDGSLYAGTFENGMPYGFGTKVTAHGDRYEGSFDDGDKHGYGYLRDAEGRVYSGHFGRDEYHGFGVLRYDAGASLYAGQWNQGERAGLGYQRAADRFYIGHFQRDTFDGTGYVGLLTEDRPDGYHYHGGFRYGKAHGHGMAIWPTGKIALGEWLDGELLYGVMRSPAPLSVPANHYHGEFSEMVPHGSGTLYYSDGRRFEGTFQNGEPHDGIMVDSDGTRRNIESDVPVPTAP